jgi:hypothetical protein
MSQGPRETATFEKKSGGDDKKMWFLGLLEDFAVQMPVVRTTTKKSLLYNSL